MTTKAVQRLARFVPQDVGLDMLTTLCEEYGNIEMLAEELGCKPSLIHEMKEGKDLDGETVFQVLSLGLRRSMKVREIIRIEVLEEIERLSAQLDIFPEGKASRDLHRIMGVVDEKSRQILWYLWWSRHAEIGELAELTGSVTDMEVLSRIKQVINPAAQDICGREILRFESSRIDPTTGEKVLFSWWLDGVHLLGQRAEPAADVFEENDHIAIIAQLPAPVELAREGQVECRDGVLMLRVEKLNYGGKRHVR